MSLYLTVFAADGTEVDGWVFGHYSDFGVFRDTIRDTLDASRFPLLMTHSDCDGMWDVHDLPALRAELAEIARHFRGAPPVDFAAAFEHTAEYRATAESLYDCFHNVDGENIFEALLALCDTARRVGPPILFQ